jgi:hypothetical protein
LVEGLADAHPIAHGTVRLLYADDREPARQADLDENGDYEFDYVPEGKYILTITGAHDEETKDAVGGKGDQQPQAAQVVTTHLYADKEMSINVLSDQENLNLSLPLAVPGSNPDQGAPQGAQRLPQ